MGDVNTDDLVVIDESGFPLNLTTLYGRAPLNERLKMPAPLNAKKVSAIGAISKEEILDIALIEGTVDQSCVESFIEHSLLPKLRAGNILLIDNAPVHDMEKINNLLWSVGAVALPLPRYSPDLSPIEPCWGKLKEIIKRIKPRTTGELYNAFVNAIDEIDSDDLENWYENCGWDLEHQAA